MLRYMLSTLYVIVFTTVLYSQAHSQPVADAGSIYFETHVRPLFAKHCYQCHSERAGDSEGGLLLDRQVGWIEGGESGPSVVPEDPDASLLIKAVLYADPGLQMPPSEQLSEREISTLADWVRMGAPGPLHGGVIEVDDPSDPIAGRSHWAFQPLEPVAIPAVVDSQWPRTAIDRFVLAKLESEHLAPVGDAERPTLLRRLAFQLTGLPPTSAQMDTFCADARPEVAEQWIDMWIASPQFAERWGRHWLDLARYSDSNGLDENFLFREAWRYRNWVINAVSEDLAFDRFLTQQIAGDLLPYDSIDQRDQQRIAAGFMVVGPKVLLGIDENQQKMDVADEHIDTIGRAVLGQTLGCARCHDHKFDPIPTADYYALAGIFGSTRVMEKRHMLNQQRLMEQLVGLGPDGSDADDAYEAYWRVQAKRRDQKKQAESALTFLKDGMELEFQQLLEKDEKAVAEIAKDTSKSAAERLAAQEALVAELEQILSSAPAIPPRAMVPSDIDEPSDEAIRLAGQFDHMGDVIPRGFLTVLSDRPIQLPQKTSGREELGRWLTDPSSRSGQLAARVLANRIWQHLMGTGLVRTVDNFGRTGEEPSHPELLDYLAGELIKSGWSVKSLVRLIVSSRTFALSSQFDQNCYGADPDNRWLWRANRRRLEPEALRDALLATAGQLDAEHFDSTVDYLGDQATAVGANKVRRRTDFPCRSVYLPVIRNDLPEIFEAFDFANPHTTTGARPKTIVPTQGLFMLNNEMVMDQARQAARRIMRESPSDDWQARIDRLFSLVLNSTPLPAEREAIVDYLTQSVIELRGDASEGDASEGDVSEGEVGDDEVSETGVGEDAELEALARVCQAVFASSRFQFLD